MKNLITQKEKELKILLSEWNRLAESYNATGIEIVSRKYEIILQELIKLKENEQRFDRKNT